MRFDVLTLFDGMLEAVLGDSIIGRARESGIIELNFINIRDFSKNKHKKVDDYPYGGGTGMLMAPQPIYDAYQSIVDGLDYKPLTIYMSPQGKTFTQQTAIDLSKEKHIVLLCGHYEGVDQRVLDEIVDMELSLGDFVLTGGEIAAMAIIDATARLIDGVLSEEASYTGESHYSSLLEYPQYTRPPEFMGRGVPEVLLSGHHANIEAWKREKSLEITYKKRPDMLSKAQLSKEDIAFLRKLKQELKTEE